MRCEYSVAIFIKTITLLAYESKLLTEQVRNSLAFLVCSVIDKKLNSYSPPSFNELKRNYFFMLPTSNYTTSIPAYPQPMPQTMASSSSSMSGKSCLPGAATNGAFTGCFGNLTPQKADCFTKMKHPGGRHHGNMSGGYCKTGESSLFTSQQSMVAMQNKYACTQEIGYGMGDINQGYTANTGGAGVPAFVTDMMKEFKQAFGDMGGAFYAEQNYTPKAPMNDASGTSPYAPIDAGFLPAYSGSAPSSPYMGGFELPTGYGNSPTPASSLYPSNNSLIDFYSSQGDSTLDPNLSYNPNNPYTSNPADYAIG
jgi:hypothetical protein